VFSCHPVFLRFKELATSWLSDVLRHNVQADQIFSHIYRWLTSPADSKMYDPLLHRFVHKLIKKCFFLLVQRFKDLGATIVYASFHKLIICTQKDNLEDAQNYVNFVLHTIKDDSLFAFLNLQINEYWSCLLYKDSFNFCGIPESAEGKVKAMWDVA